MYLMIVLHGDSGKVLSLYQCFNWVIFSTSWMEKLILKMKRRRRKTRKKRKVRKKIMRVKKKVRRNLLMKMRRMVLQIATLILNLTLRVKKKLQGIKNRRNPRQMKMNHRMWRN